jgi:hypothetical protein
MRATGITNYLKSDGPLSEAGKWRIVPTPTPRSLMTGVPDAASLDEFSKVGI